MRRYCLGAILLDLDNPQKVIAKLKEPLLTANEDEREGYVPNVVYSCGAILNGDDVVIPYAMSDTRSGFATVSLSELLSKMTTVEGIATTAVKKERNILIVEDEILNQTTTAQILKNNGYNTVVASDGLQALMEIGKRRYDLILSDINMPNCSGYELLEFMKSKKINIPLMLLTGNTNDEDELKGLELGAVDYLRKPIDPKILLLKIKKQGL
jgi:CheY-like chemotaxis protein